MRLPKPDDIEYAMENTHVLREPDRRIETFGNSRFRYTIISESMDSVGKIKVRKGDMDAHKPQIIRPASYNSVELDGFDEKAKEYLEWLKSKGKEPVFFQYGFSFKRSAYTEEIISDKLETVKEMVLEQANKEDDPMHAVIEGVDSTWEIALLKFSIDMIQKSQEIHQFDYKRKGLL